MLLIISYSLFTENETDAAERLLYFCDVSKSMSARESRMTSLFVLDLEFLVFFEVHATGCQLLAIELASVCHT